MSCLSQFKIAFLFSMLVLIAACNDENPKSTSETTTTKSATAPDFDANNAYKYVQVQVAFGPRVPGSEAQKNCAAWLQGELKKYADTVYVQDVKVTQPVSKKVYPCINMSASFNPEKQDRVLLLAHWDSRPWADQDVKDKDKPIDAADDGASGVAVLLEIAAKMKTVRANVGVDILLVDVEDVGKEEYSELSWCLGTQYWAKSPHVSDYKAMFGICLDMVGAKGARFPLEGNSAQYAGTIQREIWETASTLGYGNYFVSEQAGTITDDHLVVNVDRQIPCVDIINLKPDGRFGDYWHTHNDNIQIIDTGTLKAVGQTVMQVVYNQ